MGSLKDNFSLFSSSSHSLWLLWVVGVGAVLDGEEEMKRRWSAKVCVSVFGLRVCWVFDGVFVGSLVLFRGWRCWSVEEVVVALGG